MRVALMADLHANLPALEAVLDHARQEGAEAIWNLGDLVGYGAFPEEVVQRLRKNYALSTLGRYDRQVVRFKKRKEKWHRSKEREEYLALEWAYDHLSGKSRKYLRFLSQEIRMQVRGKRVLLTHGSPGADDGCLTPDTPEKQLAKLAREAKADLILCGCSHVAVCALGRGRVVHQPRQRRPPCGWRPPRLLRHPRGRPGGKPGLSPSRRVRRRAPRGRADPSQAAGGICPDLPRGPAPGRHPRRLGVTPMIPIRDSIRTRRTPIVNYMLIAANIVAFALLWLAGSKQESLVYQLAVIPSSFTTGLEPGRHRRHLYRDVHARRAGAPRRQHALPVDLWRQRRR